MVINYRLFNMLNYRLKCYFPASIVSKFIIAHQTIPATLVDDNRGIWVEEVTGYRFDLSSIQSRPSQICRVIWSNFL